MRTNLLFLSGASNANLKPGGPLKWKKRLVKYVRLSLSLTEVMKIMRLTSVLPRLSSPSLRHVRRLALLLPKFNPKTVYSILRSVAGSSSSHKFPNCLSPREFASVFADYLGSHFSVSQEKVLRSKARGCLSELRQSTCLEESHLSFCFPALPAKFLTAATNLSRPLPLAQTKLSISC